ncbi:MAG TPA: hypothetical protein VF066_15470 [Thermoleophilaceae bacterium]
MNRPRVVVPLILLLVSVSAPAVASAAPPSVSTTAAKSVTSTTATLTGTVNPNNEATLYHFEYGPTKSYGSVTPDQGPSGATKGNIAVQAPVGSLTPGTTYHYRLVASNASGTKAGGDKTFKTPGAITLTASRGTLTFGRSTTLAGQLSGANVAGVKVTLQQDPAPYENPEQFANAATATTDASGRFSFTQSPSANTRYVVTAPGRPKPTSGPLEVKVRFAVVVSLSTAHPRSGGSVRFSGTVSPARTGAFVRLQRRVGARWRTVKRATLTAGTAPNTSAFSVKVRVRRSGRYRVLMPGDATNTQNASRTRRVRVH